MNVLVLNGSPRKQSSNTLRVTNAFLEGLRKQGDVTVDMLDVSALNIKPCMGCFACWNKTPGECAMNDDMQSVLPRLISADVIIWSFPLYYFSIPSGLKALMDRQLPLNLPLMNDRTDGKASGSHPSRYDRHGQRTVVISTCGFHTTKGNYAAIRGQFDMMCGAGNYTAILCSQGELLHQAELSERTDAYLADVVQAGREFYAGSVTEATLAKLATPFFPKDVYEAMANASWGVIGSGEKADETYTFTRQMAALYNPASYDGTRRVVEICYTDKDRTYQLALGQKTADVTEGTPEKSATRIETPFDVWMAIAKGEIRGDEALMQGKYRVTGDFSLMLNWNRFFGGATAADAPQAARAQEAASAKNPKKGSMLLFLLPISVIMFLAGTTPWCAISCVALLVAIPLCWHWLRQTPYEVALLPCIAGLYAAATLGANRSHITALCMGICGALWGFSCFRPVPFTAYYSCDGYGGTSAWQNPIFMRTNLILTAAWSALFLLMALTTWLMGKAGMAGLSGIVCGCCSAAMGLYTKWFEKWYPAHVAGGGVKANG